jgi:hypothetical protein
MKVRDKREERPAGHSNGTDLTQQSAESACRLSDEGSLHGAQELGRGFHSCVVSSPALCLLPTGQPERRRSMLFPNQRGCMFCTQPRQVKKEIFFSQHSVPYLRQALFSSPHHLTLLTTAGPPSSLQFEAFKVSPRVFHFVAVHTGKLGSQFQVIHVADTILISGSLQRSRESPRYPSPSSEAWSACCMF